MGTIHEISKSSPGRDPFGDIGTYADDTIVRGEPIASFDGPIFSWTSVAETIPNEPPYFARDHAIQFEEFRARDSNGLARFANHSCSPNAGIKGSFEIVAMRDIKAGEEITWDYDMSEDTFWCMECRCESPDCRGMVAGYRFLPPERRAQYEGYISDWLVQPARPFVGTAAENFEQYRFPVIPKGEPFHCQLEKNPTDDEIMVVTPEVLKGLMRIDVVQAEDRQPASGRLRAM